MASSYFEAQPRSKTTAEDVVALTDDGKQENLVRPRYLTPQVSSILDSWEHSSSDESDSDDELDSGVDSRKGNTAPAPSKKEKETVGKDLAGKAPVIHCQVATAGPPESKEKQKTHNPHPRLARHPRLERFVSLRSTLFSAHVEENLQKHTQAQNTPSAQAEQDEHRSGMADSPGHPRRESLAHRMSSTLRKMTSRDVPTLRHIKEETNTKPEGDDSPDKLERKRQDSAHVQPENDSDEEESMHDEDVDDLVRWVSRRKSSTQSGENSPQRVIQPPSESRNSPLARPPETHATLLKSRLAEQSEPSSDPSESLSPTDVNDIVSWVHSKHATGDQQTKGEPHLQQLPPSVETPNRSSLGGAVPDDHHVDYIEEEENNPEADELDLASRRSIDPNEHAFEIPADQITPQERRPTAFISPKGSYHTGGLAATPLARQSIPEEECDDEEEEQHPISSTDFATQAIGASPASHTSSPSTDTAALGKRASHASHTSHKSLDTLATQEDRISDMTDEEVVELIRTVTQDETAPDEELKREAAILKWRVEKDRQEREGNVDDFHRGELSEEDVDELVKWVSRKASTGGVKGTAQGME